LNNRLTILPTAKEASLACGDAIIEVLSEALSADGRATLAISGGSTPMAMFARLAESSLDWSKIDLFWVDERPVAPDHEQSNYRLAKQALIDPAAIPQQNVHRIEAELGAEVAAQRYADLLKEFFRLEENESPVFQAVHLGMGADAHTASLFPGVPEIEDGEALVGSPWVEKLNTRRITLLPRVLLYAEEVFFLLAGADKKQPLHRVLYGEFQPTEYPSQLIRMYGNHVHWFCDQAAVS
jgi:6-phosphogluconolactonase